MGSMNVFLLDEAVYNGEKVYPYAPEDLIGQVYLHEEKGHGEFVQAEVVRKLKKQNDETHHAIHFLVETGKGETKWNILLTMSRCVTSKPRQQQLKRHQLRRSTPLRAYWRTRAH
jgi:hypothetical protein